MSELRLQPLTRARVRLLGAAGQEWLAALPRVLAALERQWSVTVGRPLPGGSSSYVVSATTAAGVPVVVKVALSREGLDDQVATLERADGRGYVRLLAYDPDRSALLLERLGASLIGSRSPEDQLGLLAGTLALAWQDPAGRPPVDKAAGLAALVSDAWSRHGRPCSEAVIAQALDYASRRTADPGVPVVVHGDPHPGNALAVVDQRPGAETGFCFVDPDGFVTDCAYDLGVALREWTASLNGPDARRTAERYCTLLAERSGVDATRIWEWGFLERVSTGLYVLDAVGAPVLARRFLDSAERLLD